MRRKSQPGNGRARATSALLALAAGLALSLSAEPALAQACCAGASAAVPARLELHEEAAAGLEVRASRVLGSFDAQKRYRSSPSGTTETDAQVSALGSVRWLEQGQASVQVPYVRTWRRVPGVSESGGGVGDVVASARYDITQAGASSLPGVGVLAAVTLPTGRPIDRSGQPLATDATGTGVFQGALGLSVEQVFERLYLAAIVALTARSPRTVEGVDARLAPLLTATLVAAYDLGARSAVGVSASYLAEGEASEGGERVPGSSRKQLTASVVGLAHLSEHWRLSASLNGSPPLGGVSQNQPATLGASASLLRAWW